MDGPTVIVETVGVTVAVAAVSELGGRNVSGVQFPSELTGAAEVRLVGRAQVRVRVPRREGVGVRRAIERGARAVTAGGVEVGVRGRERGTAEAREREEERRERETRGTIAREPAAFGTRRTRPRAPRRKHRRADATRGATRRTREAERGERRGGLAATPTDRRGEGAETSLPMRISEVAREQ